MYYQIFGRTKSAKRREWRNCGASFSAVHYSTAKLLHVQVTGTCTSPLSSETVEKIQDQIEIDNQKNKLHKTGINQRD